MIKTNMILGLLALTLFGTAQYQGWNLFYTTAAAGGAGGAAGVGRVYHK